MTNRTAALKIFITIIILLFVFFLPYKEVKAQESSYGLATSIVIKDKNVKDGDIISFAEKANALSKTPYDTAIVGVVSLDPAAAINIEGLDNTYPLISEGNAYVRVSTINGSIKKGDLITSSSIAGVGMKADKSGFVLGSALHDFTSKNTKEVGKIPVSINIYYFYTKTPSTANWALQFLDLGRLATSENPSLFLKYFIAALLLLISILFGFFTFARSASTGIEALGRNPLAGKSIQVGIFINALITIVIILAALGVAYIIITS